MAAAARGAGREFDVAVWGATGFTGRRVLEALCRAAAGRGVRLAAAGRSAGRVRAAAEGAAAAAGQPADRCGVVVADVGDQDSLEAFAARCRVVVACVGPFARLGEPMLDACVARGTHYLDVCGEPNFIEAAELKYGGAGGLAERAGALVCCAVGFDSVPCDLGVLHCRERLLAAGAVPASVESFLTLRTGPAGGAAHYATWEALINGFSTQDRLREVRRALRERDAAGEHSSAPRAPGPRPRARPGWESRVGAYALPFFGSDASVVRRTQKGLSDNPVHHAALFTVGSAAMVGLFAAAGTVLQFLVRRPWGRRLMLAYPRVFSCGVFSHAGPSEEQIAQTSFDMTFYGRGFSDAAAASAPGARPDREVVTRVSGPEPGYIACGIFVAEAALVLLEEPARLPPPGVHTPGALLWGTSYLDRLRAAGIAVEALS